MSAPAVSVAFASYRQVRFVEEALRSVLAQDHPNLQVVVYDDGSDDGTQDVLRRVVAAYDGPHDVVLDLRPTNQLASSFAAQMARCDGEWVVVAHGDDVQLPDRVSRQVATWRERGVALVASNARVVDAEGRHLRWWHDPAREQDCSLARFARQGVVAAAFGAGLGFEKRVWTTFGDLPRGPRQMDLVLCLRGLLLGGAHFDPRPGLHYRQHDGQQSIWSLLAHAPDAVTRARVERRDRENHLANRVAFVDMVREHLQRQPDDVAAREALPVLVEGALDAARDLGRHVFDEAHAGRELL